MKKLLYLIPAILFFSCGGSSQEKFVRNPVDDLIRDLHNEQNFSIILHDMDVNEDATPDEYMHKYKIIREKNKEVKNDSTGEVKMAMVPYDSMTAYIEVPKKYFFDNEKNMGMTIASKTDGKISKVASPPGYNRYVGNTSYGYWNGGSWHFFSQYMFMSSMLYMATRPVYYGSYNTYRSSYAGSRPYYGSTSNGTSAYGTNSTYNKSTNPDFFNRKATKTGWSSSSKSYSSSASGSSSSSSSSSKTGTSSSRYNGSSTRSGGGGFGK